MFAEQLGLEAAERRARRFSRSGMRVQALALALALAADAAIARDSLECSIASSRSSGVAALDSTSERHSNSLMRRVELS